MNIILVCPVSSNSEKKKIFLVTCATTFNLKFDLFRSNDCPCEGCAAGSKTFGSLFQLIGNWKSRSEIGTYVSLLDWYFGRQLIFHQLNHPEKNISKSKVHAIHELFFCHRCEFLFSALKFLFYNFPKLTLLSSVFCFLQEMNLIYSFPLRFAIRQKNLRPEISLQILLRHMLQSKWKYLDFRLRQIKIPSLLSMLFL